MFNGRLANMSHAVQCVASRLKQGSAKAAHAVDGCRARKMSRLDITPSQSTNQHQGSTSEKVRKLHYLQYAVALPKRSNGFTGSVTANTNYRNLLCLLPGMTSLAPEKLLSSAPDRNRTMAGQCRRETPSDSKHRALLGHNCIRDGCRRDTERRAALPGQAACKH